MLLVKMDAIQMAISTTRTIMTPADTISCVVVFIRLLSMALRVSRTASESSWSASMSSSPRTASVSRAGRWKSSRPAPMVTKPKPRFDSP